ncbi:hypothetical protein ZOSMA_317G00290 [Zostera marina]|uniref:GDSL esterase/lipase n=1 Tax=Zostera marina TaxID=29655 RepID=A0A0K9PBL0_ZOSMR|nr:hypothetical protein ZOSMA_317G00290 [Zostera marina]
MGAATLFFILSLQLWFVITIVVSSCNGAKTRGMFVFGSSIVDNGNNNFLPNTTAKADYLPYGIDSKMGPTGRFSNGRNMIDVLGKLLGLRQLIPPFLHPGTQGKKILHGVNFASGGSGILDQTGSIVSKVISLNEQISNFERTTLPDLKSEIENRYHEDDGGDKLVSNELSKYLFIVETGGNDLLLNYFAKMNMNTDITVDHKHKTQRNNIGLQRFTNKLITLLSSDLKKLYSMGARKFVLISVQAIGCVPVVRATFHKENRSCVEFMNQAAVLFNTKLKSLVHKTKPQMPDATVVYVNFYGIIDHIIRNPAKSGFREVNTACCEVEKRSHGVLCKRRGKTCRNRKEHVFFDGLHPTEAMNIVIANKAYASRLTDNVYPFNIRRLSRI